MHDESTLLGLRQTARRFNLSRHKLEWAIRQGHLTPVVRVSGQPGLAPDAVQAWLDVAPRDAKFWPAADVDYLRGHYHSTSVDKLAAVLGRSPMAVKIKAERLGLVSGVFAASQSVRHDYFATIERPIQAYLLGLFAADGNVREPNHIAIGFQNKDRALVETVRDELAPDKPLYDDRGRLTTLVIKSPQIFTDLGRFGIVPRKSLVLRWPATLPEAFDASFLLGYYDGDGYLSLSSSPSYRQPYPRWGLCGTSEFLESAIATIQRRIGPDVHVAAPRAQARGRIFAISAVGPSATRIDAWLHASGLGLARKSLAHRLTPPRP